MHFSLTVAALGHQSSSEHLSNGQIVPKPEPESLLPWSLCRPGSPRINSPMHAQFSPQKSSQCYSSSLLSSINSSPVRRKCSSILWLPMKLWSSASERNLKEKKKKEEEALIYFQSEAIDNHLCVRICTVHWKQAKFILKCQHSLPLISSSVP